MESEETFWQIIKDTPIAIFEVSLDGSKLRNANSMVSKFLGYSKEELLKMNLLDEILVGESKNNFQEGFKEALPGKRNLKAELKVETKNGQVSWGLFNAGVIFKNNKPDSLLVFAQNITELKKAENAIKESEQLYKALFNNSIDGFILLEPIYDQSGGVCDFRFLKVNPAYERQTGTSAAIVEGKMAKEIAGIFETEWKSLIGKVVKIGEMVRYESFSQHTGRWYDAHIFPFAKGQVGILFRDITERKKAEEALEDRNKKIVESEQSYRDLYESFGGAFIATDWELNVIHWNKVAEKLTKMKAQDALGKSVNDVLLETLAVDIKPYFEVLQKGEAIHFMLNTISRENGKQVIFEISAYPSPRGIIYIIEDKTEQENDKRLSTIGQTAGMVGHDIRNPLQAMTGDVYLANSDLELIPECNAKVSIKESLNSIQKNLDYVDKIVADLQDYARVFEPTITETDIESIFDDILSKNVIPENIEVSRKVEAGANKLFTDPDMLKRILINLVNNAVQAMPEGGKLSMNAYREGSALAISVQDNGAGIPDEIKPKLFTPLFTTRSKGQGFGLAVIKRMTEALGGTVTFESQVGKGTEFTITFTSK